MGASQVSESVGEEDSLCGCWEFHVCIPNGTLLPIQCTTLTRSLWAMVNSSALLYIGNRVPFGTHTGSNQIKSNQIVFVTYTWSADVNAGVAKCLWYIGKRLGRGQVPGVYVWMWGSSGVTPVIIHYPAAVWEAMTHTRSRNRMHGQTHANTTRTQTHSSDTVCTGTPAPQKFQWIKWNMHVALI